jgi:PmbA protein
MGQTSDIFNRLDDIQKKAQKKGADHVRVSYSGSEALSVSVDNGEIERASRTDNSSYGVTVYIGDKTASVSINSSRPDVIDSFVDKAIFNAKMQPDDPYAALIDASELADEYATLDLCDPSVPSVDELVARAKTACDAALNTNKLIVSATGAASWSKSARYIVASNGFSGVNERSGSSVQAVPLAHKNGEQQTDYDFDSQVYGADLKDPAVLGAIAAERAAKSLGAQKIQAQTAPIIFDQRVSSSLIDAFIGAMYGSAVLQKESFLRGKLDQQVFAPSISIIDDPLLDRCLSSYAFDGDGIAAEKRILVDKGVLQTWLFGSYGARKFNAGEGTSFKSTGHAGVEPSYYVEPGALSPSEMIAEVQDGFYINSLMNLKINQFDGSFSSPASGFWIKDGKIAHAVDGASIGGNILDLFSQMEAASDVNRLQHQEVPTMRVAQFKIG